MEIQQHKFDLDPNVAYLNGAYMSPLLKNVIEVGQAEVLRKARPYEITIEQFFQPVEDLKKAFAQLINAADFNRIALTPSTSYGIANAANNTPIQKGDQLILLGEQFPSNYYSWKRVAQEKGATIKIIDAPDSLNRGQAWNQKILEAINDQTAAVAIGHVHWADGTKFNLEAIRKKTRQHHAHLIIDGTQSVGAMDFDVAKIQPDALICGVYKWLMGPYGLGLAYYSPSFDGGTPIEDNWINRKNSEDFKNLVNYQDDYKPMAFRYSTGESSNFIHVQMALAALNQLNEWQPTQIQNYCKDLIDPYLPTLKNLGCIIEAEPFRSNHLFGIRLSKGMDADKLKANFEKHRVIVSHRGSAIRVSPNVYNSAVDMEKLVACFEAC